MDFVKQYSVQTEGPTPNHGLFAIVYWRDSKGNPTSRQNAAIAEIVEFDDQNRALFRTYVEMQPKVVPLD